VGAGKSAILPLQQLAFLEQGFVNDFLFPELKDATDGFLSFAQISKKYNASLKSLVEITSTETIAHIKAFLPDLFISIRFGKIFKGEILSIPPLGIINLHSAILPTYKGVLGTFRALLNGDENIGSTIHYITDHTIDTCGIIKVNHLKTEKGRSVLWHIINLYPTAIHQLSQIVGDIAKHKSVPTIAQSTEGGYYSFPTVEDFEELKTNGRLLFDFNEYAEIIRQFYHVDAGWTIAMLREKGKCS
jgi:methionyl-tRNA formyltransferase